MTQNVPRGGPNVITWTDHIHTQGSRGDSGVNVATPIQSNPAFKHAQSTATCDTRYDRSANINTQHTWTPNYSPGGIITSPSPRRIMPNHAHNETWEVPSISTPIPSDRLVTLPLPTTTMIPTPLAARTLFFNNPNRYGTPPARFVYNTEHFNSPRKRSPIAPAIARPSTYAATGEIFVDHTTSALERAADMSSGCLSPSMALEGGARMWGSPPTTAFEMQSPLLRAQEFAGALDDTGSLWIESKTLNTYLSEPSEPVEPAYKSVYLKSHPEVQIVPQATKTLVYCPFRSIKLTLARPQCDFKKMENLTKVIVELSHGTEIIKLVVDIEENVTPSDVRDSSLCSVHMPLEPNQVLRCAVKSLTGALIGQTDIDLARMIVDRIRKAEGAIPIGLDASSIQMTLYGRTEFDMTDLSSLPENNEGSNEGHQFYLHPKQLIDSKSGQSHTPFGISLIYANPNTGSGEKVIAIEGPTTIDANAFRLRLFREDGSIYGETDTIYAELGTYTEVLRLHNAEAPFTFQFDLGSPPSMEVPQLTKRDEQHVMPQLSEEASQLSADDKQTSQLHEAPPVNSDSDTMKEEEAPEVPGLPPPPVLPEVSITHFQKTDTVGKSDLLDAAEELEVVEEDIINESARNSPSHPRLDDEDDEPETEKKVPDTISLIDDLADEDFIQQIPKKLNIPSSSNANIGDSFSQDTRKITKASEREVTRCAPRRSASAKEIEDVCVGTMAAKHTDKLNTDASRESRSGPEPDSSHRSRYERSATTPLAIRRRESAAIAKRRRCNPEADAGGTRRRKFDVTRNTFPSTPTTAGSESAVIVTEPTTTTTESKSIRKGVIRLPRTSLNKSNTPTGEDGTSRTTPTKMIAFDDNVTCFREVRKHRE